MAVVRDIEPWDELLRAGREDPVLILDDVFAELDAGRRDRLAALVAEAEQVLVTAAVPADVPPLFAFLALCHDRCPRVASGRGPSSFRSDPGKETAPASSLLNRAAP